jgi:hypothetical protein
MHSKFVTNLKYAFHDRETLYLVLDLMEGANPCVRAYDCLCLRLAPFFHVQLLLFL